MDTVFIEGLSVDTTIGIYDWERTQRQPVVLTVALECDTAAITGIADAIDYGAVADALKTFVASRSDGLLETLAEACAAELKAKFPRTHMIDLRLEKPLAAKVLGCAHAGIHIQRHYT